MFEKVLVANRGEIAVRIIRACHDVGIAVVAVHSEADSNALHVRLADESMALPGSTAAESYLNVSALCTAVEKSGADAVHPGYGFLSESTVLAIALESAGVAFIGPSVQAIDVMGSKVSARRAAASAGVPVVPGLTAGIDTVEEVLSFAAEHDYPIAIKASHGGGGRGLKIVRDGPEIAPALQSARREAAAYFGDAELYLERYLEHPKHIEMQILAEADGNVLWLGERECSVQRRHQKLIEESPAIGLSPELRRRMGEASVSIARSIGYVNAGTIEFLVQDDEFYFLEMNTRLQVEHPVTELVTGIDLVVAQLKIAAGEPLGLTQEDIVSRGHAIEIRVNAEDPAGGRFMPKPGQINRLVLPAGYGVRVDAGYDVGDTVSEFYDGLVAKIICWGRDRPDAIARTRRALAEFAVNGISTTVPAQQFILEHPDFVADRHDTRWLEERVTWPELPSADVPEVVRDHESSAEREAADRSVVQVAGRRYRIPASMPGGVSERTAVPVAARSGLQDSTRRQRGAVRAEGDGVVTAPMQGTVVSVTVSVGQSIDNGDVVCVLEAMKMENPIRAARSGTVLGIEVRAGSTVAAGDVLLTVA